MPIWNEKYECMSRDEMTALQTERLVAQVKYIYENVPYYRELMEKKGVLPGDIKHIEDLKYLPFLTKQDLRDTYPYGLFAADTKDIIELHASSGTTGKQVVTGYTRKDIDIWAEAMARTLTSAGADKSSFVQVAYGYGLFTGGFGAHHGAQKIGATAIPISSGNTARQIAVLKDFGTTILACTPSYALYIAETLEEMGIDKSELSLKAGVFGAEPWSEEMRDEIERRLGITATDIYGLTEITGPGVSFECYDRSGLHVNEDHFVPEIIDPATGEVLPHGSVGELVFSCITKEGMPLLRYRTRDITSLNYEKCACGRTLVRMGKVQGRTDDMLIIRGVNVFPSQIEGVLLDLGKTAPYYMIIVDRQGVLDTFEVHVEMLDEFFSDEVKQLEKLENEIRGKLQSVLGISPKVKLVAPKSIPRSEGKAVRVIDRRKK
ncbi:MAG: phenylacetate--CoA ligase [Ruminococcaceae bacterium]|nr:phenylacetate--CoA ligase [Oscillospiraceae bacterium]